MFEFFQILMFVFSLVAGQKAKQRQEKAQREANERAEAAKGTKITVEGSSSPINVIYGRNVLGGTRVYHNTLNDYVFANNANTTNFGTLTENIAGTKHEFLAVQTALCYGGINACYAIDIDDRPWDDAAYAKGVMFHVDLQGTRADPLMVANDATRANARFTNVAYATSIYRLDRDNANYNGVPSTKFYLEGMKIHSITGSFGSRTLSGSKSYSYNPALVLLDYLTNNLYGLGLSIDSLDMETFYTASLICDKVVATDVAKQGKFWAAKGGTKDVRLYECHINLDTSRPVRENIEAILDTMGLAELVWSGGKYKLSLIYPTVFNDALTYNTDAIVQHEDPPGNFDLFRCMVNNNLQPPVPNSGATVTVNGWRRDVIAAYITDAHIIRSGDSTIIWPSAQERLNYVTVKYLNESQDFEEDTVSWPKKSTSLYTTLLAQDSGIALEGEFFERGVVSYQNALAKAEQRGRTSRTNVVYSFNVTLDLFKLEPGDIVRVNSDVLGIAGELLKLAEVKTQTDGSIQITGTKFDANTLAWNVDDDALADTRNLYNINLAQASNLQFSTAITGIANSAGTLTWNAANDIRVVRYAVLYTLDTSIDMNTVWVELGTTSVLSFELPALYRQEYILAVVSMAANGRRAPQSGWPTTALGSGDISVRGQKLINVSVYKRATATPTLPVGGTFSFNVYSLTVLPSNGASEATSWAALPPTGSDPLYVATALAINETADNLDTTLTWTGLSLYTDNNYTVNLTRPMVGVLQDASGDNYGYDDANGKMRVYYGDSELTAGSEVTFSIVASDNCTVSINNTLGSTKGDYEVTSLTGEIGHATLRAVFRGITSDLILTVQAIKVGYLIDITPPPPPASDSIVITASLNNLFINVDPLPTYTEGHGHAYIEVMADDAGAASTYANAVKLMRFAGDAATIGVKLGIQYRLWFHTVSKDGVRSTQSYPTTASMGLSGNTGFINGTDLNPLIIEAEHLANSPMISSVHIEGGAITAGKIAVNAIAAGDGVIANGAIINALIGNLAVDSAKIANAAITETKIANASITNAHIKDYIQSTDYASGSAGWKINKAGNIEMNNGIFRGTLQIGMSGSNRMEITNTAIKIYNAGVVRVKLGDLS